MRQKIEKPVEPVKSKKQELSELISTMQSDMRKLTDISQGLAGRCDYMLVLLKDLKDPSVPETPKEIDPAVKYVT